jgi:hypothetical protein
MQSAMNTEPRQRMMRLLLSANPRRMVVGDIGTKLQISGQKGDRSANDRRRLLTKGSIHART